TIHRAVHTTHRSSHGGAAHLWHAAIAPCLSRRTRAHRHIHPCAHHGATSRHDLLPLPVHPAVHHLVWADVTLAARAHQLLQLAQDQLETLGALSGLLRVPGYLLGDLDDGLHRAGHALVLRGLLFARLADVAHGAR